MSVNKQFVNTRARSRCAGMAAFGCCGILFLFSSCSKTESEQTSAAEATPSPRVVAATPVATSPYAGRATATPVARVAEARVPARSAADLPEDVGSLERRYFSGKSTVGDREAVIQMLGRLEVTQSLPTLGRIFERERRMELKMKVLEVTADQTGENAKEGRWAIFSRASSASQPVIVRLSAM